ncbi:unnamed protein product [Brachionus calyciflorus]|uniref:Acyltransferase 3 domain-containing protein n=1 Tax=Brachionus calyciflorus TaxID=104777 RepID=A0A813M5M1_9BILA|nr:unnamed protein product [Brachionus calyciflorus]
MEKVNEPKNDSEISIEMEEIDNIDIKSETDEDDDLNIEIPRPVLKKTFWQKMTSSFKTIQEETKSKIPLLFESKKLEETQLEKISTKETSEFKRFNFLDGFRGILAIVVLISHAKTNEKCELITFFHKIAHTGGVYGFFVLSAFLLTYKLLNEMNSKSNFKAKIWSIFKYFIRRFFRIYIVFFIIVTGIKFGPKILGGLFNYDETKFNYASWSNLLLLKNPGVNHLWTIAPEIKYYFFIPLFCLIANTMGKYDMILLIVSILLSIFNEVFNFFGLKSLDFYAHMTEYLYIRFSIFFYGSIAGLFLVIIERHEKITNFLKTFLVQFFLNFITVILAVYGFKHINPVMVLEGSNASRIWASFILLAALGNENLIVVRFFSNKFLTNCGKYSFGIYLLHPIFVQIALQYFHFELQFDSVVIIFLMTYFASFIFYYLLESNCIKLANMLIKGIEKWSRKDLPTS